MTLLHTPLDALHRELGARMVPFAGYDMPVQFTPVRMASSCPCRRPALTGSRACCWRSQRLNPSAWAHAIPCAWKRACASTGTS